MNKKIGIAWLVIIALILGIGAFASTGTEKASAQIILGAELKAQSAQPIDNWDKNKELYNTGFEAKISDCKQTSSVFESSKVSIGDPKITALASGLSGSDFDRVYKAHEYVAGEITYIRYEDWRAASEVLETMTGDCTDKSILLVSILGNAGIESYVVTGKEIDDYMHAWVAVNIDGKWIQIDPTVTEFYFVENCLQNSNCENQEHYSEIAKIFNEKGSLVCAN